MKRVHAFLTVLACATVLAAPAAAERARPTREAIGPGDATLSYPARDRVLGPGIAPHAPSSRVIYLNNCKPNGCTIYRGTENSRTNRSRIAGSTSQVPPFAFSDDVWDRTVQCVKETYGRFNITVTTTDPCPNPASGCTTPHWEVIVAGSPADIHYDSNAAGVSPFDFNNCSIIDNSMTYAFADVIGASVDQLCWTIAQETAHSFGLDHEYLGSDPMTYLPAPSRKAFQDVLADCGEDGVRDCYCRTKQNSVAEIMAIFGAAPASPPQITITNPTDGAVVGPGFVVNTTIVDDQGLARVELAIDGAVTATLTTPPFAFNAPVGLAEGDHRVEIRATDRNGTPASAAVEVTLEAPGALGDDCDAPDQCVSGLCVQAAGENHCSQACDPAAAGACPDGFSCASAAGGGFCVPEGGGCLGCNSDGADPTLPVGVGLTVAALILRRRRRQPLDILK